MIKDIKQSLLLMTSLLFGWCLYRPNIYAMYTAPTSDSWIALIA